MLVPGWRGGESVSLRYCGHCCTIWGSDPAKYDGPCPVCSEKSVLEIDSDHKGNIGDACVWCGLEIYAEDEVERMRRNHRKGIQREREAEAADNWRKAQREERAR